MEAFVSYVARRLVSNPDAVVVQESERQGVTTYELSVGPGDMGKLIGRKGATISALRSLVQAGGAKAGRRCTVELLED
ncbi:MAG: KH domain-containing protein [Verrucomicrobiota bacterium]